MGEYRYFLVENGDLLNRCRDRLCRMRAARTAAIEFARKHGARGYYAHTRVFALDPEWQAPVPDGWRADRKGRWVPAGGKRNKAIKAQLDALPKIPAQDRVFGDTEPAEWIGFPLVHHYVDGEAHGWRRLPLVMHITTAGEEPSHAILVPAEEHGLTFSTPIGCREITKAQWGLLCAQVEVEIEQRGLAA